MEISCTVSDEIETWALLFNTKPRIIIAGGVAEKGKEQTDFADIKVRYATPS